MIILTIILGVLLVVATTCLGWLYIKYRHLGRNTVPAATHTEICIERDRLNAKRTSLEDELRTAERNGESLIRKTEELTSQVEQLTPRANRLPVGTNIHYVDSGLGTYFVEWCENGSQPQTGKVYFPQGVGFRDDIASVFSKLSGGRYRLEQSVYTPVDCDATLRMNDVSYKMSLEQFHEALALLRCIGTQSIGLHQVIVTSS